MSPVTRRLVRPFLIAILAVASASGVAACGDDTSMSQAEIEKQIDAASLGQENVADAKRASDLAEEQVAKDADAQAAAEAVKRRQELEKIRREQKAEAEKIMNGDVEQSPVDLEEQRFRARLAGVCEGAQSRITNVSKAATKATKTKDPEELLSVAKEYNDALNDFMSALKTLDPPASQQALYAAWLGTIDDLSNNIRLQLVSVADQTAYAKLQKKTEELTLRFVTQTAQLGVTCLSVTG